MILTDDFVVLNYPRTGSTFVRQVLRRLYRAGPEGPLGLLTRWRARHGFRELTLPIDRTLGAIAAGRRSQHGRVAQVPASHAHLPLVSVWRDPLDREVSLYEHGFWRTHAPADPSTPGLGFPEFPDLTFARFLEFREAVHLPDVLQGIPLRAEVGPETIHLVRFFARDPRSLLERLTDESIDSGEVRAGLAPVRFLRFESLAEDLRSLLHEVGFAPEETAFVSDQPPANAAPSRGGKPWTDYFTPELERDFRRRERLLFQLETEAS